ncbi:MAG: SHOCT domain-containing protein [Treponema sp.]|nr:SHOCT domain-containing protein [Treponema sp.]
MYDKAAGNDGKDLAEKWKDFQKAIESVNKEFGKESPAKKESERILELKGNLAAMYVEMEAMGGLSEAQLAEAAEAYGRAADELNKAYARAVEAEEEATRRAVRDAKDKVHAAGAFTDKEEKSKTPLQDAVAQRQEAMRAEMEALTKSVEWEQMTADQKKEIWDSYYSDLAQMNEEFYDAWNMDGINNMETVAEAVSAATSKVSAALQSAGDSAIQKAEEQKNREIAIWEEKYRAGEISEQEYQDKKAELEKDAAKKEYQIKNWQWAAQVAEATANIALGVTKAIAENGWPAGAIMGAMAAAAGAIQLATVVSNKPQPPAFEKGGIVPGTSYSGDKVQIRANSGEGVFTRGQMKALGLMARGEGRKEGGTQVNVENNASNLVGVSPQVDGNRIKLLIDARVNDSMRKGRYSQSMAQASDGMTGKFYGV